MKLAILSILLAAIATTGCGSSAAPPATKPIPVASSEPQEPRKGTYWVTRSHRQDGGDVYAGASQTAYRRFERLLASRDFDGILELQQAGQLFRVAGETEVLPIGDAGDPREVRIKGGKHAGKYGWISSDEIVTKED